MTNHGGTTIRSSRPRRKLTGRTLRLSFVSQNFSPDEQMTLMKDLAKVIDGMVEQADMQEVFDIPGAPLEIAFR